MNSINFCNPKKDIAQEIQLNFYTTKVKFNGNRV